MTFVETVKSKLSEWNPEPGRQTLSVQEDHDTGWNLNLTTDRKETLGSEVWDLQLSGKGEKLDLESWAQQVAQREENGILECLRLIDMDRQQEIAVLRSGDPAKQNEDVFYYEVNLHSQRQATVRRYRASRTGTCKREQIGYTLTHEALLQLIADLIPQ